MVDRNTAAESFWRFSLMVYSRPGAAGALLGLQDRHGGNVNLILFGLWLGLCQGTRLDPGKLARAEATIAALDREVVLPLRRLRRTLKDHPDHDVSLLRQRILGLEIAAERRAQARLAETAPSPRAKRRNRQAAAEANLRLILGVGNGSEEAATLHRLIAEFEDAP